jgi:hypothetical protein
MEENGGMKGQFDLVARFDLLVRAKIAYLDVRISGIAVGSFLLTFSEIFDGFVHSFILGVGSTLLISSTVLFAYGIYGQIRADKMAGTAASVPKGLDPPGVAEFLLTMLATTRYSEAVVGDLNERFAGECKEIGRDRAVRLYWARTLRSLWPLLRRAIGKAVKWGAVISVVRRFF